jgi:thiopurine S-methyltransferase
LLICYDYDQRLADGPPFSVSGDEIKRHYAGTYGVTLIESTDVAGGLKGKVAAKENVWLLRRHSLTRSIYFAVQSFL